MSKVFKRAILRLLILLTIPLAVTSCGSEDDQSAGGGIGGTGIYAGEITDFGSVWMNEIKFDTSSAIFTTDGEISTQSALAIGMKVEIEASNSTALTVDFESEVKGPVDVALTGNIIVVMGQAVIIDNISTKFEGNGIIQNISELQVGDNVTVSGFFEDDDEIRATLIRLEDPSLTAFNLKGEVADKDLIPLTFTIQGLMVDYSGVANPPTFQNDDFIEVKGTLSGSLFVATELELETPLPVAIPGYDMEIEGIITLLTSPSDFEVNGQRVLANPDVFVNGTSANIALNVKVEVEGTVDGNGILIADEVEFE